MSLVQTVHLTMGNYKSPMVVPAVQNDSDRQLKMIVDDFTLSNSMTGKMTFKRADGTFYEAEATLALADNAFTAELDQALTCPGRTLAQLKVTATDTVSTFSFIVWVEADTSGTVTPQEGISLSEAVQRAEDAAERAEAAAESGGGLTENIKTALLQLAQKVAYIDAHGQDYYDDLYDALYEVTRLTLDVSSISLGTIGATSQITATTVPSGAAVTWVSSNPSVATVNNGLVTAVGYGSATITASAGNLTAQCSVVIAQATVTSISAVYTPSGSIYETNIPTLDTLKNDLVVTAYWSNGTTSAVMDYTLSGTLSVGSNTVTVSYGGKTTTFTVTVVALSSISAVFTQGSAVVYNTDSLDTLKQHLVVTATFADSTTQTITTGYTLNGTLTVGTSTITVSYGGKTTTFEVTVTKGIDYTEDALADAVWNNGYSYNPSTGDLTAKSGAYATDKFSVQDLSYSVVNLDTTNNTTFYVYMWDENDTYLGYKQQTNARFQWKSNYKIAIEVRNAGTFDSSTITMLPVDRRETAVSEFEIDLASLANSVTKVNGYYELNVNTLMNNAGVNYSNYTDTLNRQSIIGMIGQGVTIGNFPFKTPIRIGTFNYSKNMLLSIFVEGISVSDANLPTLKQYLVDNNVKIRYNY